MISKTRQRRRRLLFANDGMIKTGDLTPYEIASSIVGASVVVRRNEQTVNLSGIFLAIVFLFLIPYGWVHAVSTRAERAAQRAQEREERINALKYGTSTPVKVLSPLEAQQLAIETIQASWTPTVTVLPATMEATMSPMPMMQDELVFMKLSFYDPMIGQYYPDIASVNCASWDVNLRTCLSTMADGTPFANYYGDAIACPPPMQNGDVLEVTYPVQLQGSWTCRDRGWAIREGYVDFLLRYPDMVWTGHDLNLFPWSSTVQARWIHPVR